MSLQVQVRLLPSANMLPRSQKEIDEVFGITMAGFNLIAIHSSRYHIQYKIFQDWFQTKMHPEYKYNFKLVFGFFVEIQSKFKQDIKQQRS